MGDNISVEPFFNDKASEEASEAGKRDLRVKSGVDPIEGYRMSDTEINMGTSVTNYYGFLRDDGKWYIAKQIINGVITGWTYAKGDSSYDFSKRAHVDTVYASFDTTF